MDFALFSFFQRPSHREMGETFAQKSGVLNTGLEGSCLWRYFANAEDQNDRVALIGLAAEWRPV